jgi:5-methylcytosine-specific restriction endonuclease McrA
LRRNDAIRSVHREPYTRLGISQRDGWRCQLCGKKVDPKAQWPDPWFGSIDHIVPISVGGADAPANVQLAHLRCNLSKGTRTLPQGEQLRLIG